MMLIVSQFANVRSAIIPMAWVEEVSKVALSSNRN